MTNNLRTYFGFRAKARECFRCAFFTLTVACALFVTTANAAVEVAYWTFPTTSGPLTADATAANVTASIAITRGAASYTQTGTTINDPASSPVASRSLHLSGSSIAPVLTINLSGSGISGISSYTLSFAAFSSSTSTRTITWTYSLNGGAYTAFSPAQTDAVTGNGNTPDWSTVYTDTFSAAGFSTATSLSFRGTFGAATSGGAYFDNINLTAIPEPITCALAVFGLVFAGVGAGRFYLGRRRVPPPPSDLFHKQELRTK